MKTIEAYQCSVCDHVSLIKTEMEEHEANCIENQKQMKQNNIDHAKAHIYLDSFRLKSTSPTHFFKMIESDIEKVVEMVKLFYKTQEQQGVVFNLDNSGLCKFTELNSHGFSTFNKRELKTPTHSAPIGCSRVPMHPRSDIQYFAFELEVVLLPTKKHESWFNFLEFIPGINIGSGGSGDCDTLHYYCTFWEDDFPNWFK